MKILKILISPNSFKECADSVTIAGYMKQSLSNIAREKYQTDVFPVVRPISDGGDGFLSVLDSIHKLKIKNYKVTSPWSDGEIHCQVGISESTRTAYIESASVLGLKLIPPNKRHPLKLNSAGLGDLLRQLIAEKNAGLTKIEKLVVGIGGTGTSDFGIGMASVFGLKILDRNSNEMTPNPEYFCLAKEIIWEKVEVPFEIEAILDVDIPLIGQNGASRIFAPQKGATESEVEILEEGISNILRILNVKFPENSEEKLYGAGGGLAAAFHYFFNAKYKFAKDFMREDLQVNREFKADLVITGEGAFDSQTYLKKGAMIIIDEFSGTGIPVYVCAGSIQNSERLKNYSSLFFIDISRNFPTKNDSIKNIKKGIEFAAEEVLGHYFSGNISS